MAENNLVQEQSGISTAREWDENRRGRSENEHRIGRSNYGEGQQQQDYNREANRWHENYSGNYAGRESYRQNYGQQPYSTEQNRGYQQNAGYGQTNQQGWNRNYENPYYPGQQRNYESYGQYGQGGYQQQNYQQQNWNPEQNRGYYSENRMNPQSTSYAPGSWQQGQNYNQGMGQQYGYEQVGNPGWQHNQGGQQGYRSEYNRGNASSTPFSAENIYGQRGNQENWQSRNESGRYNNHKGKGPRGYQRSDERIKEDVNDRLSDDNIIDATDIEVSLTNGEVVLKGTVESREAKRRAEDIAESVSGVHNVENHLRVKQSSYPSATGRWEDMNTDRSSSINSGSERTSSKNSSRNS